MYLDYTKIKFDSMGRPEVPGLLLQTMSGTSIGFLDNVVDLKLTIKFSEPSEISFQIPAYNDGVPTPHYDDVVGYKVIYTENYGIYMITKPSISGDGIEEVKSVSGYSIEQELDYKTFFLEEGTFNFWNPAAPDDTLMGRVLEIATGWNVGYISPTLIGRYRTFTEYDDYLLDFVYNTAPEKFRCVFVFDPYKRTINVYDADEERPRVPIYLDFDNLLESLDVDELTDELVTAMRPYGADELDIRMVNPIGTNWIYDISYFISNGDIPKELGGKWEAWQHAVLNRREYYKGLVSLQYSSTARLLAEQAKLVDLQGQLEDLTNQQSITIQALAMEITEDGKKSQQELLDEINQKIAAKKEEIAQQEAIIAGIEEDLDPEKEDSYAAQILAMNQELSLATYFTEDERAVLSKYFIEQDMTEDTFVASDVDTSISGSSITLSNSAVSVSGSTITMVDLDAPYSKEMYMLAGGNFSISGSTVLTGDVIRGTLEKRNDGEFVFSIYAGTMKAGDSSAPSGLVTATGTLTGFSTDVHAVTENEITTNEGSQFQFTATEASVYMTANVSDYQKYSVQLELFDFAVDVLSDVATPTYEFNVDSGNFIFSQEFAPFRENLELGCGLYLKLYNGEVITPILIEFELDFEDKDKFSLVFSNRFKRHDNVNTLKDMIEQSYSSSRSFDASKHIYGQTVGQASMVSDFMNSSLNAAVNTIIGAANQSVIIDGAGIHIGGEEDYQIRIVDKMIAFTEDGWQSSKLAIGLFATEETGEYFGVNAEVIGGKLIVGNNMIIENENDQGVMQFKVDASGAWLNNSTFVLQKDNGGKMILDPQYGLLAGTGDLFTTEGTTVIPSFLDEDGDLILDEDGIPENANFFLDLRDGNAYFRGEVSAVSGSIGGWTIADDYLYSGSGTSFVALNGSKTENAAYAIWAGGEDPNTAPFWVKRNGDMYARDGTFRGTIYGSVYKDSSGNNMMNGSEQFLPDYLSLYGLEITNGSTTTFRVTANGQVYINGTVTMSAGSSINWANVTEQNVTQSEAYNKANSAEQIANSAQSIANGASSTANSAWNKAEDAEFTANQVSSEFRDVKLTVGNTTYINGSMIYSKSIYADAIHLGGDLRIYSEEKGNVLGGWLGYSTSLLGTATNKNGMHMASSDGSVEVAVTNYGARMMYHDENNQIYISSGLVGIHTNGAKYNFQSTMFYPSTRTITLGSSGAPWGQIYSTNSSITTSDRNRKTDIVYDIDSRFDTLWGLLKPCTGKFVDGTSGRTHMFLISQDVEQAIEDAGLSSTDFAAFIKSPREEEEGYDYGLRYEEFVPLTIRHVQQLEEKVRDLEAQLSSLQ